jgi:hypothetical protein
MLSFKYEIPQIHVGDDVVITPTISTDKLVTFLTQPEMDTTVGTFDISSGQIVVNTKKEYPIKEFEVEGSMADGSKYSQTIFLSVTSVRSPRAVILLVSIICLVVAIILYYIGFSYSIITRK